MMMLLLRLPADANADAIKAAAVGELGPDLQGLHLGRLHQPAVLDCPL